MQTSDERETIARRQRHAQLSLEAAGFLILLALTAASAVMVKEGRIGPPLMSTAHAAPAPTERSLVEPAFVEHVEHVELVQTPRVEPVRSAEVEGAAVQEPIEVAPAGARWFDGRPVRPARVLWMRVTAYSPDARSCGRFADGKTATLHSVWTNGMELVAADPRVLPEGAIVSVPGYAGERLVPVLDRGGKIKGARLDVLMPTHGQARRWGVREIPVTVWEFADGGPAVNPRELR